MRVHHLLRDWPGEVRENLSVDRFFLGTGVALLRFEKNTASFDCADLSPGRAARRSVPAAPSCQPTRGNPDEPRRVPGEPRADLGEPRLDLTGPRPVLGEPTPHLAVGRSPFDRADSQSCRAAAGLDLAELPPDRAEPRCVPAETADGRAPTRFGRAETRFGPNRDAI
jgi:hypothetical protein